MNQQDLCICGHELSSHDEGISRCHGTIDISCGCYSFRPAKEEATPCTAKNCTVNENHRHFEGVRQLFSTREKDTKPYTEEGWEKGLVSLIKAECGYSSTTDFAKVKAFIATQIQEKVAVAWAVGNFEGRKEGRQALITELKGKIAEVLNKQGIVFDFNIDKILCTYEQ